MIRKKRKTRRDPASSTRGSAVETELREYGSEVRKKLGKKLTAWIELSNYDLHYGPLRESGGGYGSPRAKEIVAGGKAYAYPGFSKAVDILRDEIGVGGVWVDAFAGGWTDVEPDWGETDEEGLPFYSPEDWIHFTRSDVLEYIVGKELAGYLR